MRPFGPCKPVRLLAASVKYCRLAVGRPDRSLARPSSGPRCARREIGKLPAEVRDHTVAFQLTLRDFQFRRIKPVL